MILKQGSNKSSFRIVTDWREIDLPKRPMFEGKFHCQNVTKDPLTLRPKMALETPHFGQQKWALQIYRNFADL